MQELLLHTISTK